MSTSTTTSTETTSAPISALDILKRQLSSSTMSTSLPITLAFDQNNLSFGNYPMEQTSNIGKDQHDFGGDYLEAESCCSSVDKERDLEIANELREIGFLYPPVRLGFQRRVYAVMTLQGLVICGITALFFYEPSISDWLKRNIDFIILPGVAVVVMTIVFYCGPPNHRRRAPLNYICLIIFTAMEALLMGSLAGTFSVHTPLAAMSSLTLILLVLAVMCWQSKWDLHADCFAGLLFCTGAITLCFGLNYALLPPLRDGVQIAEIVFVALYVLATAMMIMSNMKKMLKGNHKSSVKPEEHIFSSLNLFMTINISLLQVVGLDKDGIEGLTKCCNGCFCYHGILCNNVICMCREQDDD